MSEEKMRCRALVTLTGPSCSGKSHMAEILFTHDNLSRIVSCTSRPPRPGEVEGRDYYFKSMEEFENGIALDEFVEHVQFGEHRYGFTRTELLEKTRDRTALVVVEPQGLKQVAKISRDMRIPHVAIFVNALPRLRMHRWLRRFHDEVNSGRSYIAALNSFSDRMTLSFTEETEWRLDPHLYVILDDYRPETTDYCLDVVRAAISATEDRA